VNRRDPPPQSVPSDHDQAAGDALDRRRVQRANGRDDGGLTKRFGARTVVDGLGLAIPAGSVCGFVGPNGAGKTTTIRMLLGLVRPTAGSGTILGGSLAEPASYLHKVGALIEAPAFYPQLSGRVFVRNDVTA
jgi:ABC-type multidrug transport system ATPase subunit